MNADDDLMRVCATCGAEWTPHAGGQDDGLARELVGFDPVYALNTLIALSHETHGEPTKHAAARAAYERLLPYHLDLIPERVSERRYLAAIRSVGPALAEFVVAASGREKLELELEAHTVGKRSLPRPFQRTQAALRSARSLQRALNTLEQVWSFGATGRTLPGTLPGRHKTLLGDIELLLADGGFSQPAIARLRFDGGLPPEDAPNFKRLLTQATNRVRDRLADAKSRRADEHALWLAALESDPGSEG